MTIYPYAEIFEMILKMYFSKLIYSVSKENVTPEKFYCEIVPSFLSKSKIALNYNAIF